MKNKLFYILILLCFSFSIIGCTSNKEEDNMFISSDDTKYVYEIDDKSFYVFYYNGDTIYDMEFYTDLGDSSTASNSISLFEEMYNENDEVESITSNDKYIVINYKEGYVEKSFSTNSISVIKSMNIINEK